MLIFNTGLSSVKEGSQAERLGLRVGDTLISIGGDTLTNVHSMDMVTTHLRTAIVNAKAEGQPLKIIIERGTHEATPPPAPTQTVATPAAIIADVRAFPLSLLNMLNTMRMSDVRSQISMRG